MPVVWRGRRLWPIPPASRRVSLKQRLTPSAMSCVLLNPPPPSPPPLQTETVIHSCVDALQQQWLSLSDAAIGQATSLMRTLSQVTNIKLPKAHQALLENASDPQEPPSTPASHDSAVLLPPKKAKVRCRPLPPSAASAFGKASRHAPPLTQIHCFPSRLCPSVGNAAIVDKEKTRHARIRGRHGGWRLGPGAQGRQRFVVVWPVPSVPLLPCSLPRSLALAPVVCAGCNQFNHINPFPPFDSS